MQVTTQLYSTLTLKNNQEFTTPCTIDNVFLVTVSFSNKLIRKQLYGLAKSIWLDDILPHIKPKILPHYKCTLLVISNNPLLTPIDSFMMVAYKDIIKGDTQIEGLDNYPEFKGVEEKEPVDIIVYGILKIKYWKLKILKGEVDNMVSLNQEVTRIDIIAKHIKSFYQKTFKTTQVFGYFYYGDNLEITYP